LKGQGDAYFSPDGKRLAAASANPKTPHISVWDAQTGQRIFTLQGHMAPVRGLKFSPDSKLLASSSGDRTLRIWDLQTGQEIRTLRGQIEPLRVPILFFSPDSKRFVSAGTIFSVINPKDAKSLEKVVVKVWDVADAQKGQQTLTLKVVSDVMLRNQ